MNEMNDRLAYVVGDSYLEISRLPGVLTASQFFKAVLNGSLPLNLIWMLGQGLNNVEENLLKLCKTHQPEIRFYGDAEIKTPEITQSSLLSKLSQMVRAMGHRLGLYLKQAR